MPTSENAAAASGMVGAAATAAWLAAQSQRHMSIQEPSSSLTSRASISPGTASRTAVTRRCAWPAARLPGRGGPRRPARAAGLPAGDLGADGYLALARWLDGCLAEAERGLSATVARWRAAGERYLAVRGCHHLGQVQRAQGRLDAALATCRLALKVATPPGRPALPAVGVAHVGHVLDKLGAANRTEAVARARELGLL